MMDIFINYNVPTNNFINIVCIYSPTNPTRHLIHYFGMQVLAR